MVLSLLKPVEQQQLEDQEQFKNFKEHCISTNEEIETIKKCIFEDGKGVPIFNLIDWQIKNLEVSHKELEKSLKYEMQTLDKRVSECVSSEIQHRQLTQELQLQINNNHTEFLLLKQV